MAVDVIQEIKNKIISDFLKFLKAAETGKQLDYSNILNMISYIESINYLDNPISIFEKIMEL